MKKYEFLNDDEIVVDGKTLHRIKALRDFGYVKAGDLGGYIEKESNLSHEGDCWVYDNAMVYDEAYVHVNARVYGNARVFGDSKVFGNAQVYGNAQVFGMASVSGNARVFGNARVYGEAWVFGDAELTGYANVSMPSEFVVFTNVGSENGKLTVYKGKDGDLLATRGCFTDTIDEFLAKSKRVHNRRIHREYKLLIDVAKSRILSKQKMDIF